MFFLFKEGISLFNEKPIENGYAVDLYKNGNQKVVIGDYGIIAKQLFDNETVSESHYYSLLADLGIDITKIDETQHGED